MEDIEDIEVNYSDGQNKITVIFNVPAESGEIHSNLRDASDNHDFDVASSTLESFILALACQGVDIDTINFRTAVGQMIDQIGNEYGD